MPTETVDQLIEQLKRLKVQESVVLEKLSRAREHEKEAGYRTETPRNTTFEVGDRVRITNAITVPLTRGRNERDRTATVRYTKPHNEETKVLSPLTTDSKRGDWRRTYENYSKSLS